MKIINIKSNKLLYIIIIVLLIAQPLYYTYHNNTKISAYKIGRGTDDLALIIEDLTLISINGGVFIEPGWKLRTGSSNKDTIKDISLTLSIGKNTIFPINFGGEADTPNKILFEESSPLFISKIKINDKSIINMKIKYSLNGESREYSEDLELKSFATEITQFDGDLIQYIKTES